MATVGYVATCVKIVLQDSKTSNVMAQKNRPYGAAKQLSSNGLLHFETLQKLRREIAFAEIFVLHQL